MSLSLLAPLGLALGLLLALPIAAHLARQVPRDRQVFGAMLLLERVVKRLRRRRRIKDPWLLLLRLLAVAALVLAIAAPALSLPGGPPAVGGSGRVVVLVDRSLSMSLVDGGTTLLQRARQDAARMVRSLGEGVLVGLVVFGDEALRVTPVLTAEHERVAARIDAIEPTAGTSDLRSALLEARRMLASEPGEVVVFTDEAGPRIVAEAEGEIERLVAAGASVVPRVFAGSPPRNVAVTSASYGDGPEGGQVTLRVSSFGPDPVEVGCEVTLPDGQRIPIFVDVPPLGDAEERITVPTEAAGGVGEVRCDDADLPLDDSRFFHLPRVGASRVLVVDGDPGDTPVRSEVYFLERALAPWGIRSGVQLDIMTPAGLADLDPNRHRVVFLANVADPRPFGPRLVEFVRRGGNVVVTGGDNVTADRYNAALGGLLPAQLRGARSVADADEQGVAIVPPDVSLPLFAPFRRAGKSAFSRIRGHTVLLFVPYTDVTDEVETLLAWDNGMPAMVQRKVGLGRIVVYTGTLDLAWGNLPLQSVFMPLVQRLVGWLGGDAGAGPARLEGIVGHPVELELPDLATEPVVRTAAGEEVHSRVEASRLVFVPEKTGAYKIEIESAPPLAWVAVNTDAIESDVRPYGSIAAVEREIAPELLTRKVDLARPLLGVSLGLLVVQALAAFGRRAS